MSRGTEGVHKKVTLLPPQVLCSSRIFAKKEGQGSFVPLPLVKYSKALQPVLCINQIRIDDFLHSGADIVHSPNPFKWLIRL